MFISKRVTALLSRKRRTACTMLNIYSKEVVHKLFNWTASTHYLRSHSESKLVHSVFNCSLRQARSIEQRFLILKDFGFPIMKEISVAEFELIIRKSPKELIASGDLTVEPVQHVLNSLEEEVAQKICVHLSADVYCSWPLSVIHEGIITLLISAQLECTQVEALNILKKQAIFRRSVTKLHKVILLLINDFGFKRSELFANPEILMTSPENLSYYLNQSEIDGTRIIKKLKCKPWILKVDPKIITELDKIYQEYEITDEQLRDRNAYKLIPMRAAQNLKEIEELEELKALKHAPNYLSLVYFLKRVKKNLEMMRIAGYTAWSISKITLPSSKLEKILVAQIDSCQANEASYISAHLLGKPVSKAKERLKLHPKYRRASHFSVHLVIEKLLDRGVTKEQIWYCLPIILYDADLVVQTLSELETYSELSPFDEWRTHIGLVHLVLYYIEKKSYFNFEGVFLKSTEHYCDIS